MRFVSTSVMGGDCTTAYNVYDYPTTVGEFIDEILKNYKKEWGEINVNGFGRCEYKHGKLLSELPAEVLQKRITKVRAAGGWSNMDYRIDVNPYLYDAQTLETINCLCCKNCLPPLLRENGKMCKLDECKFDPA